MISESVLYGDNKILPERNWAHERLYFLYCYWMNLDQKNICLSYTPCISYNVFEHFVLTS